MMAGIAGGIGSCQTIAAQEIEVRYRHVTKLVWESRLGLATPSRVLACLLASAPGTIGCEPRRQRL
jgi:hypothetical protein